MNASRHLTRRRALQIVAGVGGLAFVGGVRVASASTIAGTYTWRGIALGARASITLCHPDRAQARRLLRLCVSEVARLENVFSLYRRGSEIVRLNGQGFLDHPSPDFVHLLSRARGFGELTNGAFDATVQPLWILHANHFARGGNHRGGPDGWEIDKAVSLIGYRNVSIAAGRIEFARAGMGITLNGIAQGYITDRVAELLRNEGLENVLVDLGEIRGLGRHVDGRPWAVDLQDPLSVPRVGDTLNLENAALASSVGSATRFDESGRHHHLFDPHKGTSTNRYLGVTVVAPGATVADALSTAFASMDVGDVTEVLKLLPSVTVRMTSHAGEVTTFSG